MPGGSEETLGKSERLVDRLGRGIAIVLLMAVVAELVAWWLSPALSKQVHLVGHADVVVPTPFTPCQQRGVVRTLRRPAH